MRTRHLGILAAMGALFLGSGFLIGCLKGPEAGNPEEFYRGKTIRWVVSAGAGTSPDVAARILGPYISKEIGAAVKVENMTTESGLNWVYTQGSRDGLTMLIDTTEALVANDMLKAPGVEYQTEKFNFLADVIPNRKVLEVSPKLPHRTLDALRQAKGLKAGGTSAKGGLAIGAALMIEILGLDSKVITGYTGGKRELTLAVARGEIDFMVTPDNTAAKDEADGNVVNLFTVTTQRSRVVPNLPTIAELGVKIPKGLESAYSFLELGGQSALLPPDVPQEKVDYLRKLFLKLSDNKDVQKDMEKITTVSVPFVPGEQLQKTMSTIKADKGLATQIDAVFAKYKGTP